MTLDCVSTQSRVISAHSWYLTSFVILSFSVYPSFPFCHPQNTHFLFSSENTSLFGIVLIEYKGRILLFSQKLLTIAFLARRLEYHTLIQDFLIYLNAFHTAVFFHLTYFSIPTLPIQTNPCKVSFENLVFVSPLDRTSFVTIVQHIFSRIAICKL